MGCCNLKCENIEPESNNRLRFDFLGKDSMRYENTVEVEEEVYNLMCSWKQYNSSDEPTEPGDKLFDTIDATDLNNHLKNFMPGLSAKVFRTYNASLTLDRLLHESETDTGGADATLVLKTAEYHRANKEVAILCNHQRSVPKGHEASMEKMREKIQKAKEELADLEKELKMALKGKNPDVSRTNEGGKEARGFLTAMQGARDEARCG